MRCSTSRWSPGRAARGLVCVNHEYFNGELMWQGHGGAGHAARRIARRWMEQHPTR